MDRQLILNKAWETVDEIKSSSLYQNYLCSLQTLQDNPELCQLVETFNRQKAVFAEVSVRGKYHPDFSKEAKKLADAKDALYGRKEFQEFLQSQDALNKHLLKLSNDLQEIIDQCKIAKKNCRGRS